MFEPQNSITSRVSHGHSLYQVGTLRDNLFLRYAADKQTDRQIADWKILPTLTDIVGVGNKQYTFTKSEPCVSTWSGHRPTKNRGICKYIFSYKRGWQNKLT